MRIACIHIPQFALQCATRRNPSLRGEPVAMVGGGQPGHAGILNTPVVLACSRAAWALGVRLGMTAPAARALSNELELVTADAACERETSRAIADALLALTPTVDLGGRVGAGAAHLAMYAEVPLKTRGTSFGERILEVLDELGLTARIGIADDRFTAWVAAHDHSHGGEPSRDELVVAVPRGGSAAFLAPYPLSLLAISPEVQHMLEALGVRTLGEFAMLPAPSVSRPLEADYRALARGESTAALRPYAPEAPIREQIAVSAGAVLELQDLLPAGEHAGGLSIGGAIALVAKRIALRLAGRGRAAARIEIAAGDAELSLAPEVPIASADELAHQLADALASVQAEHARQQDVWQLHVDVVGEAIAGLPEMPEILAEGSSRHVTFAERDLAEDDHLPAHATADHAAADHFGADTLAIVLSSPGSLFALSPPARREDHRRLRRGKTRRARPTPQAQARLFEGTSSK